MEQEYTNNPDKERTIEELCRDINLRAEEVYLKLSKKGKYILLVLAALLVVLMVLNWQWVMDNPWWCACWLGACALVVFVVNKINHKLINDMKRAASPKENLRLAKRLKRFSRIVHAFGPIIVFWTQIMQLVHEKSYVLACLVTVLLFVFGFISSGLDPTLNGDLHELEYRLDE